MVFTKKQLQNFWSKIDKTNGCWNWNAYTANGYGRVNINGSVYLAHKVMTFIHKKTSNLSKKELGAAGVVVMHKCDNRSCVNPDHLIVATQKENMQDAKIKKRKWNGQFSGENNPNFKLKQRDVELIRVSPLGVSELSRTYSVNRSTIYSIKNNKSWINI